MNRRLMLYSSVCFIISITVFFVSSYNIVYALFSINNIFGSHYGNSPGNNFGNSFGSHYGNSFGSHYGNSFGSHYGNSFGSHYGNSFGNYNTEHGNEHHGYGKGVKKVRGNYNTEHGNEHHGYGNGHTKFNGIFNAPSFTLPFNSNFADQSININKGRNDIIPFP